MQRGTRAAKRKRQYRARRKKRERLLKARWYAHYDATHEPERDTMYGQAFVSTRSMQYMQWVMTRAMRKHIVEWEWLDYSPHPGAAQGVTLDNPQNGLVPVIPLRAGEP